MSSEDLLRRGLRIGKSYILPIVAVLMLFAMVFSRSSGCVEVEPGEVAVLYNTTGLSLLGPPERVIKEQGIVSFVPLLQRIEKLDVRPQIFVMEGKSDVDDNHVHRLTVRANDGSNFYFERLEIHYQVIPSMAAEVIRTNGRGDDYKWRAMQVHSREVLRDEFGKYSFLQIADPSTYGEATTHAKQALNERLNPLGVEVTNIPPPKPKFDDAVEQAIDERQNAEQEVEVQGEKRKKLEQEKLHRIQQVDQQKNAEYQQLLADLQAKKQQANNALIAERREADKYFIEREAEARALRDQKVTQAQANEYAYQEEAKGLVAKIQAVGNQGSQVLNREIAEHVFPQLSKLKARPYSEPKTPIDVRTSAKGE